MYTIRDIKQQLGPGLGLRKSKYLLEIPLQNGLKMNILCQATSFPERNMSTTSVWHAGRKYNIRGETDYSSTYEISIVDDSEMKIRSTFDSWMYSVDNSNFGEASDGGANAAITPLSGFGKSNYSRDINIWQIGNDGFTKVYGYCLQNAFPSSLGAVTLEDGDQTTLSEFSVVFTYSEFVPVSGTATFVGSLIKNFSNLSSIFNDAVNLDLSDFKTFGKSFGSLGGMLSGASAISSADSLMGAASNLNMPGLPTIDGISNLGSSLSMPGMQTLDGSSNIGSSLSSPGIGSVGDFFSSDNLNSPGMPDDFSASFENLNSPGMQNDVGTYAPDLSLPGLDF